MKKLLAVRIHIIIFQYASVRLLFLEENSFSEIPAATYGRDYFSMEFYRSHC